MPKYLITYHMPQEMIQNHPEPTPEQFEEGMKVWYDWRDRMGTNLLDLGTPLNSVNKIDSKGIVSHHISHLSGYSILQADNVDQLLKLMIDHPHIGWADGPHIEIHEMTEM